MAETFILPHRASHGRVTRAAISVLAAGIAVKLIATAKESVVAALFGRSDAMDAYLAAFLIPNLLIYLVAEPMNQALIPTLIRVRLREGREQAQQLLSSSMAALCAMLAAASIVIAIFSHALFPLVAWNFGHAKQEFAIHLFYALLPCLILGGIASTCTAVLNASGRFAVPAIVPAVIPLAIAVGAVLFHRSMGIWALAAATVLGMAVHACWMAVFMRRSDYGFGLHWHGWTEPLRAVAGQYGPAMLGSVAASAGLLVDQAMAAMLPPGSVSALVFAGRFPGVAMVLLAGAISTALGPWLSELVAMHEWGACRGALRSWAARTAIVSVPAAAALIAGARLLVRIVLQHGAFGSADTRVVAFTLSMYALQIPFFAVSRVAYRFLVALRRNDLVLACGAINLTLDVVLNIVLMRWMGVAGIALATSIWSVTSCAFLWFWALRLLNRAESAGTGQAPMTSLPEPAQYLLRVDDLCPTVDRERWQRLRELIAETGIRPILAVVPDNHDPALAASAPDPEFWSQMRLLESQGANIALHGWRHVRASSGRSFIPRHRNSEFAGAPFENQCRWIESGLAILRHDGLNPRVWVAPWHGFDRNTLRALRLAGIEILSDGLGRMPVRREGLLWIPQQMWQPEAKTKGLWTICVHPNTMTDAQAAELRAFVLAHASQFTSVERVIREFPICEPSAWEVAREMFLTRKLLLRSLFVRRVHDRSLESAAARGQDPLGEQP